MLEELTAHGFEHIASLAGWYEVEGRLLDATLGILQELLLGFRDGWELALDELRSDPAGLLDRLEALGTVIGELHSALGSDSSDPAFSPDEPSAEALAILTADVDEQIERVFLDLPEMTATEAIVGSTSRPMIRPAESALKTPTSRLRTPRRISGVKKVSAK